MESELLLAAAKPMIESLVEELFVPRLKEFLKSVKIKSAELLNRNKGYFNEYLLRTYDKYSIINALAIPNSQFRLKDVYVTQTLVKDNRFEDNEEITKVDRLPVELIKKYQRLLITDTAGMGKSTILKRMFIDLIDNCIKDVGVPIYIELNRLNKERNILLEIQEELNSLSKEFDKDLLLAFIQKGGFIFFLDGYDEISIADRSEVTKDVQTFISKAGANNYFILTSRPEDSLASFGDFQSFKIQPLTKKEAFELLSKYDITKQKKISEALIKELNTGKYSSIDEFLKNPLLVSLLFSAYHFKAEIPLKKHLFYRQVYDALFNAHKLAQGQKPHEKRSGLDIDDFNRVLRYIGYECLIKIGVQFDKDTILKSIGRAKDFCRNLKFGESELLEDLITSVPLFIKDGNEYKWAHKSLMEYFAARFIADDTKEKQNKILLKIYNSKQIEKYLYMLDLYYDLDFNGFDRNFRYQICKDYVLFCNSIDFENVDISKDFIYERKSILFACRNIIIKLSEASYYSFMRALDNKKVEEYLEKQFNIACETTNGFHYKGFGYNPFNRILVVHFATPVLDILGLLYNRNEQLFQNKKNVLELEDKKELLDQMEEDKVNRIDINSGESSREEYLFINFYNKFPPVTLTRRIEQVYLDYNACKKIKDDYEKNLEKDDLDLDSFD